MTQLLSPVCTDPIKFQNGLSSLCPPSSRWSMLGTNNSIKWNGIGHGEGRRRRFGRVKVATDPSPYSSDAVADDYYAVLGLLPDATPEQIKKAYYNCMKSCHPDLSGNNVDTTNLCIFINEVYEVLSDPAQRMVYDEIHGYALTAINPFYDDASTKDHVFVDEFSCIGCKNCANVCSEVFTIEEDFGRARACNQQGSLDLIQQAIDSCPVDCIHWTSAAQVSLFEDEMRRVERVNDLNCSSVFETVTGLLTQWVHLRSENAVKLLHISCVDLLHFLSSCIDLQVALMLAGMGSSADVFRMASTRWEKRQNKVLEEARIRMMKQKDSNDKSEPYWSNLWGNETPTSDEEMKERANRAAAAARRWREYSRRGVDKPATYKLPSQSEK